MDWEGNETHLCYDGLMRAPALGCLHLCVLTSWLGSGLQSYRLPQSSRALWGNLKGVFSSLEQAHFAPGDFCGFFFVCFCFCFLVCFIATWSRSLRGWREMGWERAEVLCPLVFIKPLVLHWVLVISEEQARHGQVRAHVRKDHLCPGKEFDFPFECTGKTL